MNLSLHQKIQIQVTINQIVEKIPINHQTKKVAQTKVHQINQNVHIQMLKVMKTIQV